MKTMRFLLMGLLTLFSFKASAAVIVAPDTIKSGEHVLWSAERFYVIENNLVIEEGGILEIETAFIMFRYHSNPEKKSRIIVKGLLKAREALFSSERDPYFAFGNTVWNGMNAKPQPGDWGYFLIQSKEGWCYFDNCTLKYGGGCKYTPDGIDIENAMVYQVPDSYVMSFYQGELSYSKGFGIVMNMGDFWSNTVTECENGLKFTGKNSLITSNTFRRNRKFPIVFENCFPSVFQDLENFTDNGIQGIAAGGTLNGADFYVGKSLPDFKNKIWNSGLPEASTPTPNQNTSPFNLNWGPALPPVYIFKPLKLSNLNLTIEPGTVVKFMAPSNVAEKPYITADSLSYIDAVGTKERKITFTSQYDFDYVVDKNLDFEKSMRSKQAPKPLYSDWGFVEGRRVRLQYCDFKYGGVYYNPKTTNIQEDGSGIVRIFENYPDSSGRIDHCTFKSVYKHAIVTLVDMAGVNQPQPPLINYCSFLLPADCRGVYTIGMRPEGVSLDATLNFWNSKTGPFDPNSPTPGNGCQVGDYIQYKPFLPSDAESGLLNLSGLHGSILDEQAQPIIHAKVILTGRKPYTTFSDSSGSYMLRNIDPGFGYKLEVNAAGFYRKDSTGLLIYPDTVQKADMVLIQGYSTVMIDTLNFNINPVVSRVGVGGKAIRFYKLVDKKTMRPVYGETVTVDENRVFTSDENGLVKIEIPATQVGSVNTSKTFTITGIGNGTASLAEPDRIPFTVKVVPYTYLKSWAGEAYISLGVDIVKSLGMQKEKRRGASLELLMQNDNQILADSLYITRKSQNGIGLYLGAGDAIQVGDFYSGAEAQVGVNMFKLLEDKFHFDYQPHNQANKDKLALAQFIVLADGMLPYMDAPLVRLLVRCLERRNDEIRAAGFSNSAGCRINAYGMARAGLSASGPSPVGLRLNVFGSISGEANVDFNYSTYPESNRKDFTLSLSHEVEGELSLSSGFGMLNTVSDFGGETIGNLIKPVEGSVSARVFGDLEFGTARNVESPFSWLSLGSGYDYDLHGRVLNKEGNKESYKDIQYTFYFQDSVMNNLLKNSSGIAKSFLGTLSGGMDINASTQSMGNTFSNSFQQIARRQQTDPKNLITLPYEKTSNAEFAKGSFDISLPLDLIIVKCTFGAGYEFTGLNKYTEENGVFYDNRLYPLEQYPPVQNNDSIQAVMVIRGIVTHATKTLMQEIKDATSPAHIFRQIGKRLKGLFHLKSTETAADTMNIGPPARKSYLEFIGYPMMTNSTDTIETLYATYWDWYGIDGKSPAALKSTHADWIKISNYIRQRETALHKLDFGIGGFFQFEPYNTHMSDGGALLRLYYRDDELNVMLNDSSAYTIPEGNLRIYQEDKLHHRWNYLGGKVNVDSNYVLVRVDSLGTFTMAPFVPAGEIELFALPDTIRLENYDTTRITSGTLFYDTGEMVPESELYTVEVSAGSSVMGDASETVAGKQVKPKNGKLSFAVRADSVSGLATIKVTSHLGNAIGMITVPVIDATAPSIPVITNGSFENGIVTVNWTTPPDRDMAGFKLYYDTLSGGPYLGTASVSGSPSPILLGNDTLAQVNGLNLGKKYYFSVTALDRCGNESGYSNEIQVKTWYNNRPLLYNSSCKIDWNVPKGSIVDTLIAEDADKDQQLTFFLNHENDIDVFTLDSVSGILRVDKPEQLVNLAKSTVFEIHASVKDNGEVQLVDDAVIRVYVKIQVKVPENEKIPALFEMMPNPASQFLEVRFIERSRNDGGDLQLINDLGQLVLSRRYNARFPESDLIDLSDLPAGVYYLKLNSPVGQENRKLVIVR